MLSHTYVKPKRVSPHFPSGLERAIAVVACLIQVHCQKTNWLQTDKIFSFICNKLRCEVHSSPFLSRVASFKRLKQIVRLSDWLSSQVYQDVIISLGCPAPFRFVQTLFFHLYYYFSSCFICQSPSFKKWITSMPMPLLVSRLLKGKNEI